MFELGSTWEKNQPPEQKICFKKIGKIEKTPQRKIKYSRISKYTSYVGSTLADFNSIFTLNSISLRMCIYSKTEFGVKIELKPASVGWA